MHKEKTMKSGMHPEEVKAAIRKRGTSMAALSTKWGFGASAISVALYREMPSVEPLIAKYIGKSLHEIWPDRYTPENIRIHHLSKRSKRIRSGKKSHAGK